MSAAEDALLAAFDGHDVEGVRAALAAGADAVSPVRGKAPLDWLLREYTRSDRLGDCLRLLLERGATFADPAVAPVLLNDAEAIHAAVRSNPALLSHRATLVSAFTSLVGVSLLHVAAEFGNFAAAQALVAAGADVNARAELSEHGLNGHTPLFHAVNSIHNRAAPILRLLLDAGAHTDIQLAGLEWGKGYEWETTFFDVTPLSFAQMGLLPQVHRQEAEIYANIRILLAAGRRTIPLPNVPNRYLLPKG